MRKREREREKNKVTDEKRHKQRKNDEIYSKNELKRRIFTTTRVRPMGNEDFVEHLLLIEWVVDTD